MKKERPQINSFVVFDKSTCSPENYDQYYKEVFDNKLFVYLGEIKQCPGHCILANLTDGKIIGMYHTDNFREALDGEV